MKNFCLMLCVCLCTMLLCSCEKQDIDQHDHATSIYATFYPLYTAAEWLVDDVPDVKLHCLVQPQDGCLRGYQLSDWDLSLLNSADLILAGGCGLESFESVLYGLGEKGPVVSALFYNMDLREQRGTNTQNDSQSHWLGPNPHIYMQTEGMKEITRRIANTLMMFDPKNEQTYRTNLENALLNLDNLHAELSANLAHLKGEKVIVMNEALIYAVDEYGLEADLYYDRETGVGLYDADLESCLKTLGKSAARVVLIEKQAPRAFCEALEAAGYSLARMDILSTGRVSNGAESYWETQRANAQALINAFVSF